MDLQSLPDAVANLMLGVAHELDETAIDHDLVNGSTITSKIIRFTATSLVLGAIPWVALDVITGGLSRRGQAVTTPAQDSSPIWWSFIHP